MKVGLSSLVPANSRNAPRSPIWQPSLPSAFVFCSVFNKEMIEKILFLLQQQLNLLIILAGSDREAADLLTIFVITHMKA